MGVFGRDSTATKVAESTPGIGQVASAVHAHKGDHERARRAAAKSTNSTMTTAGTIGGGLVGGPAGALAGGAAGAAGGHATEAGIAKHIDSSEVSDGMARNTKKGYAKDTGAGAAKSFVPTPVGTAAHAAATAVKH